VERGELVVARRDTLRHEVLTDELFVLLDGFVHVAEDDALLLPALLHVLVDDLGLVLCADARERVLLGLRNPQLVEGVFDLLGQLRPVVDAGTHVDVRADIRDDLVDVDLADVGLAGPVGRHRHLLELLQRAQATLEHPFGLVFVLGDDADRLLGEALVRFKGGFLLLFKLEAGLGVGLFQVFLFGTHGIGLRLWVLSSVP